MSDHMLCLPRSSTGQSNKEAAPKKGIQPIVTNPSTKSSEPLYVSASSWRLQNLCRVGVVASKEMKSDRKIVMAGLFQDGRAFRHATADLRGDAALVRLDLANPQSDELYLTALKVN